MRTKRIDVGPEAEDIALGTVELVNLFWRRKLRTSVALEQTIQEALDEGYPADQCRAAVWVTACMGTGDFPKRALGDAGGGSFGPLHLFRFKRGVNPETGKEAVAWLDDRWQKVGEMNAKLLARCLEAVQRTYGQDRVERELAFLRRIEAPEPLYDDVKP